ncbi:MAG: DUF192 domain-containing protein [Patescibacteria group bacterium]|nr:DUF192 domain-containing protein [Patescibacteria group bacterium]
MKIRKGFIYSFIVVILFVVAGFVLISRSSVNVKPEILEIPNNTSQAENIKYVKIAGKNIKVDLALTPSEQSQGLSGRASLDENTGMLFVFDRPDKYAFWMKDMNFSIDMIWIGEDNKIVFIKKNALPKDYPETYQPGMDNNTARYVLEITAGFSEKNNLKIGDEVVFTY